MGNRKKETEKMTTTATTSNATTSTKAKAESKPAEAAKPAAAAKPAESATAVETPAVVATPLKTPEGETIVIVELAKIDLSFPNARTLANVEPSKNEHENDFKGLLASLEVKGQEMPVILRFNKKGNAKTHPYQLVAGFRRVSAIKALADAGKMTPHVKAVIREMSDLEATEVNAIENTSRASLSPADTCWSAMMIKNQLIASGTSSVDDGMVANIMGLSVPWTSRLLRIANTMTGEVLQKWRNATVKLTMLKIDDLAKMPADKQDAAFEEMVKKAAAPRQTQSTGRGVTGWIDKCKADAEAVGALLASLEFEGHIKIFPFEWEDLADIISPRLVEQREKLASGTGKVRADHITNAVNMMAAGAQAAYEMRAEDLKRGAESSDEE